MNTPITSREIKQISKILFDLEKEAISVYRKINGGFAVASLFNYDNNIIDIELKFGSQDDSGSYVHTEQYKIDRKSMKLLN